MRWLIFLFIGCAVGSLLSYASALEAQDLADVRKKEIVYGMYAEYKKNFPGVKDISPEDAMALLKENRIVFVDARSPGERQVSMLPDAVSKEVFLENPGRFKDRTIVTYCTISYRSGKFAEEMNRQGVTIYNLQGGILAWVLEGGKVFDGGGESKRIHVYGDQWNYLPRGYEAVKFGFFEKPLFGR